MSVSERWARSVALRAAKAQEAADSILGQRPNKSSLPTVEQMPTAIIAGPTLVTAAATVTALISWAHRNEGWSDAEADEWGAQVIALAARLRQLGVEADLDLYHLHDDKVDWTRFGPASVKSSDYVIVLMSTAWAQRWSGENNPKVGAGATAEADALHGLFSRDQEQWHRKVKIVMLPGVSGDVIPPELERVVRFYIDPDDPDSYEDLIRTLTGQPLHAKPPLGTIPTLPDVAIRKGQRTALSSAGTPSNFREQLVGEVARVTALLDANPRSSRAQEWREQRAVLQGTLDAISSWSGEASVD